MVTLHTGAQVCSSCPAWLTECEAAHLLKLPLHERRAALAAREKKCSKDEVERMKAVMLALHEKRKK